MHIVFRVDASLEIGTGHVVRCATLAKHLVACGHEVLFISRETAGDLIGWLVTQKFQVARLANAPDSGDPEEADVRATRDAIGSSRCDWVVLDHYELGRRWEQEIAAVADRVMAIDDVGREHDCDFLLDQNLPTAVHQRYSVRESGRLLLGPEFALVRDEFAQMRPAALARPRTRLSRIVVFMGGSDALNETTKAVKGVGMAAHDDLFVDVVIGAHNPHRIAVEIACKRLRSVKLHVQAPRMAEILAAADCAIGAAGSVTWERCVLGLPALVTILADNQEPIARAVETAGASRLLGWHHSLSADDYANAVRNLDAAQLQHMSHAAAEICDGQGTKRVAAQLFSQSEAGMNPSKRDA